MVAVAPDRPGLLRPNTRSAGANSQAVGHQVAQVAVYDFDTSDNETLAAALERAAADARQRPGSFASLLAEAARRLRTAPEPVPGLSKYQVSIDGGEWDEPTSDVPAWAQSALSNPYRTSVSVTHQNGVTYRFRRAEDD